jgi:hypothetical protein
MMPTLALARESVERRDYRKRTSQPELTTQTLLQSKEINRLLTAAVVNRKFCSLLLADPLQAVTSGYNGETFKLTPEEVQQIRAINASTLRDFALQLLTKNSANEKSLAEPQPTTWQHKVYAVA